MIRRIFSTICSFFFLGLLSAGDVFAFEYHVETPEGIDITVYAPNDIEADKLYPVLYLFHGKWQQPSVWEEIGLGDALNKLSTSGEIDPFFVILPHDRNYMEDMYESEFYDMFIREVMPYVELHYPVSTEPDLTALGGISRGSLWAQFFAFSEYGRFGHIGVHSPPNPFFSQPKLYGIIRDHPGIPYIRIRIDIGNNDYEMRIGQDFSEQLTELFYPHEFHLGVGGHDIEYWAANLQDYLRWYNDGFTAAIQ